MGKPTEMNSTVLETLQPYAAAKITVNRRSAQDFQMFSTSGNARAGQATGELTARINKNQNVGTGTLAGSSSASSNFLAVELKNSAQQYGSSTRAQTKLSIALLKARAEAEDGKLRKDPLLEVLALKVPFGKLLPRHSRITSRGRDNLRA